MSTDKEIVIGWAQEEFLQKLIKEAMIIDVPGGGTSDQRYYALKRILKAAEIRLDALAPRQVDVDDLKMGDPKSGSPETEWKFVEGYNQAVEDLAQRGLIGNAEKKST